VDSVAGGRRAHAAAPGVQNLDRQGSAAINPTAHSSGHSATAGTGFAGIQRYLGNSLTSTGKEQTMTPGTRLLLCVALLGLLVCAPLAVPAQSGTVVLPVTGTVNGGTFEGTLTLTDMTVSIAGQLVASGTLVGTVTAADGTVTPVSQTFTDFVVDLTRVLRRTE
jgi:hypothetical protein